MKRSSSSTSSRDLKFPTSSRKSEAPKSCAMKTVWETSYRNLNSRAKCRESFRQILKMHVIWIVFIITLNTKANWARLACSFLIKIFLFPPVSDIWQKFTPLCIFFLLVFTIQSHWLNFSSSKIFESFNVSEKSRVSSVYLTFIQITISFCLKLIWKLANFNFQFIFQFSIFSF